MFVDFWAAMGRAEAGRTFMIDTSPNAPETNADLKKTRRVRPTEPDKLPTHSMEAEAGVLGCILLSPDDCLPECLEKLHSSHAFYDLRHQTIYESCISMHRARTPIDLITLQQWLNDKQLLENVGGIAYLSKLQDDVHSASNLSYWLDIVLEKYQLRRLHNVCLDIARRVDDKTCTLDDLRFSAQSDLADVFGKNGHGLSAIVDATDFMATPHTIPSQIIEGILHKGSKMSLSGNSKAYKTWLYADLAISVAAGSDWLGFNTIKGKVLYVNFEIQEFAWHERINTICNSKGIKLQPGMLHFWNLKGHACSFRQLIPKIIEHVYNDGFDLIIIDPIYKMLGGADENSATDIAELLNSFDRLVAETGAALAYAHHFAKGNASAKEAIDRQGGSGVFGRDPDSLLVFTAHEEPGSFTVEPILRNFSPVEPFVVSWHFPLMDRDDQLDPGKLKQVAGRKKVYDTKVLLGFIAQNDEQNPISISKWAHDGNIPRNTLIDYLPEMKRRGWIKVQGEGNTARRYITNEGKAFLDS